MPRGDGLTPQSRRILAVLRARGNWVQRKDLAQALQTDEFSTYQLKLLNRLIDKGLIEDRRYRTGAGRLAHEYKAKP